MLTIPPSSHILINLIEKKVNKKLHICIECLFKWNNRLLSVFLYRVDLRKEFSNSTPAIGMQKRVYTFIYKRSRNIRYKIKGEVENIVNDYNHTVKCGQKWMDGVVLDLLRSAYVVANSMKQPQ